MPATTQPRTPWGRLIKTAREAAGLSIPEAAGLAGISATTWGNIERGVRTENGTRSAIDGPAATVAAMARVVRVTPERLETGGERPDAAESLREMLRSRGGRLPAAPEQPAGEALISRVLEASPEDQEVLKQIMRIPDEARRQELIEAWFAGAANLDGAPAVLRDGRHGRTG